MAVRLQNEDEGKVVVKDSEKVAELKNTEEEVPTARSIKKLTSFKPNYKEGSVLPPNRRLGKAIMVAQIVNFLGRRPSPSSAASD